jgi:hypothetical protein
VAIPHGARAAIARAAAELATVTPFSELWPIDRARLAAALDEVTFQSATPFSRRVRAATRCISRLFAHRQARPTALAYGVATFVALCASVPVWRAFGLL